MRPREHQQRFKNFQWSSRPALSRLRKQMSAFPGRERCAKQAWKSKFSRNHRGHRNKKNRWSMHKPPFYCPFREVPVLGAAIPNVSKTGRVGYDRSSSIARSVLFTGSCVFSKRKGSRSYYRYFLSVQKNAKQVRRGVRILSCVNVLNLLFSSFLLLSWCRFV